MGDNVVLTTDKADANIQPSTRELRHNSRNFFEVFMRNANNDFTLKLDREQNTIWTCTIHKGDYRNQSTDHEQGQHFVDRHRTTLINRVSETAAILDQLKDRGLISNEKYDAVRALKTTQDQMRDILKIVTSAGTRAKDAFYEILKSNARYLIDDLEKPEQRSKK